MSNFLCLTPALNFWLFLFRVSVLISDTRVACHRYILICVVPLYPHGWLKRVFKNPQVHWITNNHFTVVSSGMHLPRIGLNCPSRTLGTSGLLCCQMYRCVENFSLKDILRGRNKMVTCGLPQWLSGENELQCGRPELNPWVRKIPWRRAWQPTPVLLPGESHGQRSLVGFNPWGSKRVVQD